MSTSEAAGADSSLTRGNLRVTTTLTIVTSGSTPELWRSESETVGGASIRLTQVIKGERQR